MRRLIGLLLFAGFLAIAPSAHAQQAAKKAVPRSTPAPTPTVQKIWAAKIQAKYSGSFLAPGLAGRKTNFSTIGEVVYRANDRLRLTGIFGFNQIIEPLAEFTLTNPEFRAFYRLFGKKQDWSFHVGPTAALPLSAGSQDESLYFAAGAAARLVYNRQDEQTGGFLFYYDFGFNRNIHQFETSNAGDINTMSSINHLFYFEYLFEDSPVSIDGWVGFSSAWSYTGKISNEYNLAQEVNYTLSDLWDLTLAHKRGGNFLSPNGQNYNFGLFNAQESRFYLAVTLKL